MEPMEPAPLCALPAGGRCPRGGSALTTLSLTTFWSSQPDSCNPRSSTLATPGTGHAVMRAGSFPRVTDRCCGGWDLWLENWGLNC